MPPWLHVLAGVIALGLGGVMFFGRHRVVARHVAARGRAEVPATGWAVMGVVMLVNGFLQLCLALLFASD